MNKFVTHYFAHTETLDRAERWLLQRGFRPSQIAAHREGVPWISVIATPEQKVDAEMIFRAAEVNDPDGWPSFWDTARMPHPHVESTPEDVTTSLVATARATPVGWHPSDVDTAREDDYGLTRVWDVSTRFGY
jgi:hypothetical protein